MMLSAGFATTLWGTLLLNERVKAISDWHIVQQITTWPAAGSWQDQVGHRRAVVLVCGANTLASAALAVP